MGEEYQSDTNSAESVCTEDFAVQFKQRMVEPIASSQANENAQYNTGKTEDYSESVSLLLPSSDDSPGDHLNTARREDILQQFKEELEDDLKATLTKNAEDQASGRYRERKDSMESLGGQISRLSQANHSPFSSVQSIERVSVGSHLSSRGGEELQPALHTGSSTVRENMSRTELSPSTNGYQAVRELNTYPYEEQRHSTDVDQIERNTINVLMSSTDMGGAGCPADTLDASHMNRSEGFKNGHPVPTKEDARGTGTVYQVSDVSVLPSCMDRQEDAGEIPVPSKKSLYGGAETGQANCTVSLSKS